MGCNTSQRRSYLSVFHACIRSSSVVAGLQMDAATSTSIMVSTLASDVASAQAFQAAAVGASLVSAPAAIDLQLNFNVGYQQLLASVPSLLRICIDQTRVCCQVCLLQRVVMTAGIIPEVVSVLISFDRQGD